MIGRMVGNIGTGHCLYILAVSVCAVMFSGCTEYDDAGLFTSLTLETELPDGAKAVLVTADNSLKGTFIRNVNTLQSFDYPAFVNGRCTLRIPRGVYMLSFDGTATLDDGSKIKVRYAGNNTYESAVTLLEENEKMVLKLTVLK